jgi:hypothetical protein
MADAKTSALTALTTPASVDLLLIIDDPNGTPVSKKITLVNLFDNIPSNTTISGTFTASANSTLGGANTVITANLNATGALNTLSSLHVNADKITIGTSDTPSTNNATTEYGTPTSDRGWDGTLSWDADYLYVAVSNTVIHRIALGAF